MEEQFTHRSLAVALMAIARYLAQRDGGFLADAERELENAAERGLDPLDLSCLRTIVAALRAAKGVPPPAH